MEAISTLPDKFSWRRTASVGLLFKKSIRNYLILSAAVSLVCYLLVRAFSSIGGNTLTVYMIMSTPLSALFYLNPLTFSRRDDTLMTLLPAKPIEKWTFYIIYCLIIVPCVIQGVWYGADFIYSAVNSVPTLKDSIIGYYRLQIPNINCSNWLFILFSTIQAETMIIVVLYVTLRCQRHRVIKSLLAILGFLLFIGILSGIAGAVMAFHDVTRNMDVVDPAMIIKTLRPLIVAIYIFVCVIAILGLWLTYRCIAKGEVKN